jgi:hypothetical protein
MTGTSIPSVSSWPTGERGDVSGSVHLSASSQTHGQRSQTHWRCTYEESNVYHKETEAIPWFFFGYPASLIVIVWLLVSRYGYGMGADFDLLAWLYRGKKGAVLSSDAGTSFISIPDTPEINADRSLFG